MSLQNLTVSTKAREDNFFVLQYNLKMMLYLFLLFLVICHWNEALPILLMYFELNDER